MAFPKPVPTLSEDEIDSLREEMEKFEISDEMKEGIERHRQAIREDE